jgi:hypothetical protein
MATQKRQWREDRMDKVDLDLLVDIAQEVEGQDAIDWNKLAVSKDAAYKMVATSILEMFDKSEYTFDDKVIIMSTITKLTVENMLLNIRVLSLEQK